MKIYLSIAVSLLLSHALAMPHQEHDEPMQLSELESSMPSETDRLHELFDVVESGLSPNAEVAIDKFIGLVHMWEEISQ